MTDMRESILNMKKQLAWALEIQGPHFAKASRGARVISCGMGGSNIASGFLEMLRPDLDVVAHRTYGLPTTTNKNDLVIISSYSGNTEEALDAFEVAIEKKFNVVAITTGGELLKRAHAKNILYIQIPQINIQPRMALGYSLLAMLKAVGDKENIKKIHDFSKDFDPKQYEEQGEMLAQKLARKIPIIYTSWKNKALAYAWKIKFNETAKVPAFFNTFPELNHNEMVGWSEGATPEGVCGGAMNPHFIFLKDDADHERVYKRMTLTEQLLKEKGFLVEIVKTESDIAGIFNSLVLADWVAYCLAQNLDIDPEAVPMVEDFKSKMAS
jgi:glucose/mannose-6-phosphate isomerase